MSTYKECDWIADELRVLFHNLFDSSFLEVFCLVVFQVQDHPGATPHGLSYMEKRCVSASKRCHWHNYQTKNNQYYQLATKPLDYLQVSTLTVKEPPADDSQAYCSSSLCLVITVTFSATR